MFSTSNQRTHHIYQASQLLILWALIGTINGTNVKLEIKSNTEEDQPIKIYEDEVYQFSVSSFQALVEDVVCETNKREVISLEKISQAGNNATFKFLARRLGVAEVSCGYERGSDVKGDDAEGVAELDVWVLRAETKIDMFFLPYVFLMVAIFNLAFGTEIALNDLKFILRNPLPLFTAAVCQFIILPPMGLGVAKWMGYDVDVALGMLMVACAPGGAQSNAFSYLVDGEVPLSIAMTFFSTLLAIGTMPLNLFIYGRFISDDPSWTAQDIPYHRLGGTLLLLAVPVCIGMLLRSYCPNFTRKMMKIAKPLISIMLLVFFCLAIFRNLFAFALVSVRDVAGSCLLPCGGFIIGTLLPLSAQLRFSKVKTIALEVGMQNAGIVVGMSLLAFEQPHADLNGILPIFMALTMNFVALPLLIAHVITIKFSRSYRELCKKDREALENERKLFEKETKVAVNGDMEGVGIILSTEADQKNPDGALS